MNCFLIADGGSTKTHWALVSEGKAIKTWRTSGMNPYFMDSDEIERIFFNEVLSMCSPVQPHRIYFYGAGCSSPEKKQIIFNSFKKLCSSEIFIEHDMLAVARSLFGNQEGIACILGTGSNACAYDGKNITYQVPSFGYLWGDQGSGSYIGKKWAEHYFYRKLPDHILIAFEQKGYSVESILTQTYRSTTPNRFLASMAPAIFELSEYAEVQDFLLQCFDDFFELLQNHFPDLLNQPVGFCGSVAFHFQYFLKKSAQKFDINISQIHSDPIPGLIAFHEKQ